MSPLPKLSENFNDIDPRDPKGEYLPVSVDSLSIGIVKDLELFVRAGNAFFLVKPKNVELNRSLLSRFMGKYPHLYIPHHYRDVYFKALETNLTSIIKNPNFGEKEKASVLSDYAVEIVDQMLRDPTSPVAMKSAENFAKECVNFMNSSRHAFIHLVELSSHDHYTYAHSVGVSAYAIALAQSMGTWDKQQIANIGLAGLLHDLGKSVIDSAILNKAGPLTEAEWEKMKSHPYEGAKLLRTHKHLSDIIPLCAEAHHEDLRGLGYPKGIIASKLDSTVQIITLADAFSALTTNRSYSKSTDALTALKLMRENINKKFDPVFFEKFVKVFLDPQKKSDKELIRKAG